MSAPSAVAERVQRREQEKAEVRKTAAGRRARVGYTAAKDGGG